MTFTETEYRKLASQEAARARACKIGDVMRSHYLDSARRYYTEAKNIAFRASLINGAQ